MRSFVAGVKLDFPREPLIQNEARILATLCQPRNVLLLRKLVMIAARSVPQRQEC
jgi:hypothetical protein